jgi:pyruvate/2-oxoglutarate dehydrogenase complex dihydrolipoamide dehydrogenase (E3) component
LAFAPKSETESYPDPLANGEMTLTFTSVLHREDPDVSSALETLFRDEGIELILNARIQQVAGLSGQAVWANGEVAGSPQFTHIAFDDFRILRENLNGGNRVTTGRQVPFSMFTDPELARVGLSEAEAKARGASYRLFKIPMSSVLRTRTLSEMRGFMKALVGEDDRILGFTVFGVDGGEIMSAVQIAMIGDLPYTAVRDAILAHPTLMEGLIVLFSSSPVSVDSRSSDASQQTAQTAPD